jgi:hypothetical protein
MVAAPEVSVSAPYPHSLSSNISTSSTPSTKEGTSKPTLVEKEKAKQEQEQILRNRDSRLLNDYMDGTVLVACRFSMFYAFMRRAPAHRLQHHTISGLRPMSTCPGKSGKSRSGSSQRPTPVPPLTPVTGLPSPLLPLYMTGWQTPAMKTPLYMSQSRPLFRLCVASLLC